MSKPYIFSEVDENFFETMHRIQEDYAEAVYEKTLLENALSILEKDLMKESAASVMSLTGAKSVPEFIQRRDAKSDPRYKKAALALASAERNVVLLRGRADSLKMQFEAWRTRQANRRNGNG